MELTKYAQLKQEIAKLELRAEKIRKQAIDGVIKQIKGLMEEHGINLGDLQLKRGRGRPPKATAAEKPAARAKKGVKKRATKKAVAKKPAAKKATSAKKAASAKKTKVKPAASKVAATKAKTAKPKGKVKYRSPSDKKLVWAGRGRPPTWVKEWVDSGKKLNDLLIK